MKFSLNMMYFLSLSTRVQLILKNHLIFMDIEPRP